MYTKLSKPDLIIMDFDGTLVDSRYELARISHKVLSSFKVNATLNDIKLKIGLTTEERFRIHGVKSEHLQEAVVAFEVAHAKSDYTEAKPVEGIGEWLERFRETPKWILSSAPEFPIKSVLERLGLDHYFNRVICRSSSDSFNKTDQLRSSIQATANQAIWHFGDEIDDLQAGTYVGAVLFLLEGTHNSSYRFLADFLITNYTRFDETMAEQRNCDLFSYIKEVQRGVESIELDQVQALAASLCNTAACNRTIYLAGNGGCYALTSHFATDLRRAFLTAGVRALTYVLGSSVETISSLSNDMGWNQALWKEASVSLLPGDLVVILSTSGRSFNLVELEQQAKDKGASTFRVYPQTVLSGAHRGIAPLTEDIFSTFCSLTTLAVRRKLLWNATNQKSS